VNGQRLSKRDFVGRYQTNVASALLHRVAIVITFVHFRAYTQKNEILYEIALYNIHNTDQYSAFNYKLSP